MGSLTSAGAVIQIAGNTLKEENKMRRFWAVVLITVIFVAGFASIVGLFYYFPVVVLGMPKWVAYIVEMVVSFFWGFSLTSIRKGLWQVLVKNHEKP